MLERRRKKKILIVEDDPDICLIFKTMLEECI
jgi:CheY-like chemotaxis protein